MIKINFLLVVAIVLMAINSILWHFEQHTAFKSLQKLYKNHEYLVAINQQYLSQYSEALSLLTIEKYAKEHFGMIKPKKRHQL